jgi:hypothetical protein
MQTVQMQLIQCYFTESQCDFWKVIRTAPTPCALTDISAWSDHFRHVFNADTYTPNLDDSHRELKHELFEQHLNDPNNMVSLNAPITEEEVVSAFQKLPNMKAAGADGITAECFKAATFLFHNGTNAYKDFLLAPLITSLLNAIFIHGDFPKCFAINTLTPIFKGKGDPSDMNNYRGIAVGSLFCKIFESILYTRYNTALEGFHLRNPSQFGFRKEHGTLDGLFVLRHLVDKAIAGGKPLYALFIDFEKAFDRVPRELLIDRCKQLGCSGQFLNAMVKMLEDIQMQIKCNGQLGVPFHTSNLGIKQGGLLSPLTFGSFMEQLHDLIKLKIPGVGTKIGRMIVPLLMYADDVTGLVHSPEEMTILITNIELFCTLFGMKINASKTFVVIFHGPRITLKKLRKACAWKINGHDVTIKEEAKFLGLTFHHSKGVLLVPKELALKGNKAMYAMLASMKAHHINQSAFLCKLFDQLVYPVLSYGCQVWGPDLLHDRYLSIHSILDRQKNPLEGVHIDFLRHIGGLPSSCSLWLLFKEFARTPLHSHWLTLCTRFWCKAVDSVLRHENTDEIESNVLLCAAMFDNITLSMSTTNCWVSKFMKALVAIGVISGNDLEACTSVTDFVQLPITESSVKESLDRFWTSTCSSILHEITAPRSMPDDKSITFSRYNAWVASTSGPAHLTAFLPTHIKHMIIRFRVNGYPLAFQSHKLKNKKTPRSQRLCEACKHMHHDPVVEDDMHFLLECPVYNSIRNQYPSIFSNGSLPSIILNNSDQALLGKALHHMLQHRSTMI